MTMNKYITLILLFSSSLNLLANDKPDIEEFKKQYAGYQKYVEEKKWDQALPFAKKTFELGRLLHGDASKSTAALSYNYGLNLIEIKNLELAKTVLTETITIHQNAYGEEAREQIPVLMTLGDIMSEPFRATEAQLEYFDEAISLTEIHYGADSVAYGQLNVRAGESLLSQARSRLSKKYLYRGLDVLENKLGADAAQVGYAAFYVGKYELSTKDYDDAVVHFNKALATFAKPDEPESKFELSTHSFLVNAYQNLNKEDEATKHCLAIGRMTPTVDTQNYQPIAKFSPVYPRRAIKRGEEGEVVLVYDVDESGFVVNVRAEELVGSNYFEKAALESAKRYRYAPAFKDGKPILTKNVSTRVIFQLSKKYK